MAQVCRGLVFFRLVEAANRGRIRELYEDEQVRVPLSFDHVAGTASHQEPTIKLDYKRLHFLRIPGYLFRISDVQINAK